MVGPKVVNDFHKAVAIPRMQPNGWLIKDIEGVYQGGAYRGSKIDPSQFTAGERSGLAVLGEVIQANIYKVAKSL